MFILYSVIIGLIIGYMTGGRLRNIIQRPLYWRLLAIIALAVQMLIFSDLPFFKSLPNLAIIILHYASYVCLLVFIVRNAKNLGILTLSIGVILNTLVIFLNGGHMPTIPENLKNASVGKSADLIDQGVAVHNSAKMTTDTLLPWLGDIFYMPSWIPFSNVFSIGDIFIAVGVCVYLFMNMRPVTKRIFDYHT